MSCDDRRPLLYGAPPAPPKFDPELLKIPPEEAASLVEALEKAKAAQPVVPMVDPPPSYATDESKLVYEFTRAFEGLDLRARARVMRYLVSRFGGGE